MNKIFIILYLLFTTNLLFAQFDFDKNYFSSPLKIPLKLAGNFGECRPNHFHTGLDFKTNQVENLPVYAAADGYVARINISHTGYGNCLYINHDNGLQTVYAHLNDFIEPLMDILSSKQYQLERWNVDFNLGDDVFPVKKGQLIAYSGNTGGSVAPHLHFEVRTNDGNSAINPCFFNFQLEDNIAPQINSISIYNADLSIYEQNPIVLKPTFNNNTYAINIANIPFQRIYLGVSADDKMNGSANTLGIYEMKVINNNKLVFHSQSNSISFENNRMLNAYIDYKSYHLNNKLFQLLFRLPNNKLQHYIHSEIITLTDSNHINVELRDYNNNIASLKVNIKSNVRDETKTNNVQNANVNNSLASIAVNNLFLYDNINTLKSIDIVGKSKYSEIISFYKSYIPLHDYVDIKIKLKTIIPINDRSKLILVHPIKASLLPGSQAQNAIPATYENGYAIAKVRNLGNYYVDIDKQAPTISLKSSPTNNNSVLSFEIIEKETSLKSVNIYINNQWICFKRKNNTFSYKKDKYVNGGTNIVVVKAVDQNDNEVVKEFTVKF